MLEKRPTYHPPLFMSTLRTALALCATLFTGLAQADIFLPYGNSEFSCSAVAQPKAGPVTAQKGAPLVAPGATRHAWLKRLSGNIGLGYDTKYISRGMANTNSDTDHVFCLEANGMYALSRKNALAGGIAWDHFLASQFGHGGGTYCDAGEAIIEFVHRFNKRTLLAGGYQYIHGGYAGFQNPNLPGGQPREFPPFMDSDRPEEHSLVLDFHHEFAGRLNGFFWDSRVQYAFHWEEGWWFINTLGYKYALNGRTDITASATWNASMNYFDADSCIRNSNGTQGYTLELSAPTMVSKHVRLTPHIGLNFIGNGADKANAAGGWYADGQRYKDGTHYRNVTLNLGIKAQYVF